MEITTEIKLKVFAQYFGQKIKSHVWQIQHAEPLVAIDNTGHFIVNGNKEPMQLISSRPDGGFNAFSVDRVKLVLKPLSEITDEDAVEIAKIINPVGYQYQITEQGLTIYYGDWDDFNHYSIYPDGQIEIDSLDVFKTVQVYQYLISKGYDLQNYLLEGKTLYEAGLAVYTDKD